MAFFFEPYSKPFAEIVDEKQIRQSKELLSQLASEDTDAKVEDKIADDFNTTLRNIERSVRDHLSRVVEELPNDTPEEKRESITSAYPSIMIPFLNSLAKTYFDIFNSFDEKNPEHQEVMLRRYILISKKDGSFLRAVTPVLGRYFALDHLGLHDTICEELSDDTTEIENAIDYDGDYCSEVVIFHKIFRARMKMEQYEECLRLVDRYIEIAESSWGGDGPGDYFESQVAVYSALGLEDKAIEALITSRTRHNWIYEELFSSKLKEAIGQIRSGFVPFRE
jgi:hypothetical protein